MDELLERHPHEHTPFHAAGLEEHFGVTFPGMVRSYNKDEPIFFARASTVALRERLGKAVQDCRARADAHGEAGGPHAGYGLTRAGHRVFEPGAGEGAALSGEEYRAATTRLVTNVDGDQGGSVETSGPTTLHAPVFVEADVIHYRVKNLPVSAMHTLSNALSPHVRTTAGYGLVHALASDVGLGHEAAVVEGRMVNGALVCEYAMDHRPLQSVLHPEAR